MAQFDCEILTNNSPAGGFVTGKENKMTEEVLTQTRVVGVSQARTVTAKIKGYQYPVELLGYRKQGDFTIVRVRVLPREDGFQPKPFRALGDVYPPFVYSPEGEVLKSMLEVK